MGNYRDIEFDFINRTLGLLSQYESAMHNYAFEAQFNYTLLINCLLGLVVLPKERTLTYLPNNPLLDDALKVEMGIINTQFNSDIRNLKTLIIALRHSVAHFDIVVKSRDEQFNIDQILFMDKTKSSDYEIARFQANELLPFIRYYSGWLLSNMEQHRLIPNGH